jgi:hypothetical protein
VYIEGLRGTESDGLGPTDCLINLIKINLYATTENNIRLREKDERKEHRNEGTANK